MINHEEIQLPAEPRSLDELLVLSETKGVLSGDPEDELMSEEFQAPADMEVILEPGYPFWRTREDSNGKTSRPYISSDPVRVGRYRLRKDNQDQLWLNIKSVPDEGGTFEKIHVRVSRLVDSEHHIQFNTSP